MPDADPRFAHCPECAGGHVDCPRCDGEGIVEIVPVRSRRMVWLRFAAAVAACLAVVGGIAWNAEHEKHEDRNACAAVGGRLIDHTCVDRHAVLTPGP